MEYTGYSSSPQDQADRQRAMAAHGGVNAATGPRPGMTEQVAPEVGGDVLGGQSRLAAGLQAGDPDTMRFVVEHAFKSGRPIDPGLLQAFPGIIQHIPENMRQRMGVGAPGPMTAAQSRMGPGGPPRPPMGPMG